MEKSPQRSPSGQFSQVENISHHPPSDPELSSIGCLPVYKRKKNKYLSTKIKLPQLDDTK